MGLSSSSPWPSSPDFHLPTLQRMQTATLYALLASALVQVGSAATRQLLAQAAFGGAGVAGMFAILSLAKVGEGVGDETGVPELQGWISQFQIPLAAISMSLLLCGLGE